MKQAAVEFLGQLDKGNHSAFLAMLGVPKVDFWIQAVTCASWNWRSEQSYSSASSALVTPAPKGLTAGLSLPLGAPGLWKPLFEGGRPIKSLGVNSTPSTNFSFWNYPSHNTEGQGCFSSLAKSISFLSNISTEEMPRTSPSPCPHQLCTEHPHKLEKWSLTARYFFSASPALNCKCFDKWTERFPSFSVPWVNSSVGSARINGVIFHSSAHWLPAKASMPFPAPLSLQTPCSFSSKARIHFTFFGDGLNRQCLNLGIKAWFKDFCAKTTAQKANIPW